MSMYKITVKGAEDINPEYNPDKQLINGIDADGFVLLVFKKEKLNTIAISHVTILQIAEAFAGYGNNDEPTSMIQQAIAIAEGLKKAKEIKKENDKYMMAKGLADILRAR